MARTIGRRNSSFETRSSPDRGCTLAALTSLETHFLASCFPDEQICVANLRISKLRALPSWWDQMFRRAALESQLRGHVRALQVSFVSSAQSVVCLRSGSTIQRFNCGEAIRVHSCVFVVNIRRWLRLMTGE